MSNLGERFWSKVGKGSGCWIWTASRGPDGRGQIRVGATMERAHRVAWMLTYGRPPLGILRSACGNLQCVKPDHQVDVDRKVGAVNLARTPAVRFDAMVSRGPNCWLWTGSADYLGYGQFSLETGPDRRMVRAHRFAWEQAHGPVPRGADVLHSCGIRRCVRPDHLELRVGGQAPERPTSREIDVIRASLRSGLRHGSLKKAAAEVGINYDNAAHHLARLRARLRVATNVEAVAWLDENEPGWRCVETAQ